MARNYPDWLRAYMDYSSFNEAPDRFHFWTGVSAIGGALRRKVYIDQGYFQWSPNFYIIFVAPPGVVNKSTTVDTGMQLLRQCGVKFGPNSITWQSLTTSLAESTEGYPTPNGLFFPMSCLTIASSEFGTFFDPRNREMVDVLVDLWDGKIGVWKRHTKTQGKDEIENPWLNIIACTTPAWIAGNFPEYLIGGGFTSRCVFVYAEQKRRLVAYPKNILPTDFLETQMKLVQDLEHIAMLVGEYELSPEATEYGEAWYKKHYERALGELDGDRFAGYMSRKQTHIHKLAMVIAAAKRDEMVIHREDLEAAAGIVSSLEVEMPKVFAHIGASEDTNRAREIVHAVSLAGEISRTELFKKMFRTMSWEQFEIALVSAMSAGYVVQIQKGEDMYLRVLRKPPDLTIVPGTVG